ncbi:hypothetical protein [Pontibacter vulgaris]|uniref:hypothetical protein n=1 Tax=Pontibacter vulgaris TaxID=2905679 RepID=UPI001FA7E412|nr:hypothetical protein [Pontibacter vulgaris]
MGIHKQLLFLLTIILGLGLSSCEDDDDPKGTLVPGTEADFFFQGNLNGSLILLEEGEDDYISTTAASKIVTGTGCWEMQDIVLKKELDERRSVRVTFIKKFAACPTQCPELEPILRQGKYGFGKIATTIGTEPVEGIVVTYTDPDGNVWSTDKGTARQQGSLFSVTAFNNNTIDSQSPKITEAQFTCILYDGTGKQLILNNGKITSRSLDCSKL